MASKSKGCNFSLSATDSSAVAKFSSINASHSRSIAVFKVTYRTLLLPYAGKTLENKLLLKGFEQLQQKDLIA